MRDKREKHTRMRMSETRRKRKAKEAPKGCISFDHKIACFNQKITNRKRSNPPLSCVVSESCVYFTRSFFYLSPKQENTHTEAFFFLIT